MKTSKRSVALSSKVNFLSRSLAQLDFDLNILFVRDILIIQ